MATPYLDSLRRRVRTLHLLWERALADMTLEQINHQERPGVLPIAFSLVHTLRTEDRAVQHWLLGQPPPWERDGWAGRVGVAALAPYSCSAGASRLSNRSIADGP